VDGADAARLSGLTTSWTLLQAAHDPAAPEPDRSRARQELLLRYLDVARRYLGGALRGQPQREEAIDQMVSDFSVRVMSGAFGRASPDRGRFRDYLRTVLVNLVSDYRRANRKEAVPLGEVEPATEDVPVSDEAFNEMWRDELVRRALAALAGHEARTGEVRYSVLRLALDHPGAGAAELARRVAERSGRAADAAWVRKRLYLARRKLREALRDEVRQTLREPTDEAVEEELAEIGLLAYCR
jgi:RNA polymerase sigma factor (sigma-70 family)